MTDLIQQIEALPQVKSATYSEQCTSLGGPFQGYRIETDNCTVLVDGALAKLGGMPFVEKQIEIWLNPRKCTYSY